MKTLVYLARLSKIWRFNKFYKYDRPSINRRIINMEREIGEKEMNKFKRHPTTSSYKGDILFLL